MVHELIVYLPYDQFIVGTLTVVHFLVGWLSLSLVKRWWY